MTPEDAVSEYRRVIAEYDARYGEDPLEKRRREREAEQQERRQQKVRKIEQQSANAANAAAWEEWFRHRLITEIGCKDEDGGWFIDMMGEVLANTRKVMRKEFETKLAAQEARIKQLEAQLSLETKFYEMEHRLDARQLARDEAKRGLEMVPQSELPAKIEALQHQVDELESVADLDGRFRQLAERVTELEKTNSLEARFSQLADEVKRGSDIPQGELLEKIEKLQRHDDLKKVADLDARFRQLAERVGEIEKTNSLEARFAELANEAKGGSEIPQGELLEKIEALQRQLDDPDRVADLDVRFRELTERVGALEQTSSLEARFSKFADEVKRGSELPQSELLPRIDRLERQLDDLKRIPGQSGPQGPPGKDGKLPIVKVFQKDAVYYTGDVVICDGSTYQALRDTGQNVNHADWVCLARAGRNGSDGRSPNVCGTYDAREKYERLDIVALDGTAFIARRDNPGLCPSDGWQLLSKQGRPGHRGENGERGVRGEKGERGEPGATVVSWQLDRRRYRVSPLMSDGKVGPALELRALFEQYHAEADQ